MDGYPYRALAFANDAGGFEVRNAGFQGTIGKDLSYLPLRGSRHAAVFEGFFDFLSVLAHYGRERANANVLVLNSLSMLERARRRLQVEEIGKLYSYLDRDDAGRDGLSILETEAACDVVDTSVLYDGYKDANEFLVAERLRHNI